MSDSFTWRLEDASGRSVEAVETSAFPSQGDAEAWLAESWQDLADAGVAQVTLLDGVEVVYGPMSLAAG